MAGYQQDFSKSNNAVEAEQCGIFPITVATKIVAKKYGVAQRLARKYLECLGCCEWHHSSKHYNEVSYYDTNLTEEEEKELMEFDFEEEKREVLNGKYKIDWVDWEGSRNNPRKIENSYEGYAEIKGDWIQFKGKRKKLSGNWITVKRIID